MAVNLIQGKQIATASWSQNAVTASYAPAYLPLTGGTIDGNVTVNGTASIAFLSVAIESASVIYSSGSNVFGDATNDTQRLNGTVIVSGSQQITGSLTVVNTTPRIILRNSGSGASGQIVFTAIDDTFTNKSVGTTVFSANVLDINENIRGGIVFRKASNSSTNISINNSGTEGAFYISGSGNVGIRTTAPNSASLHVSGNVWASSFTGSLLGTASFALSSSRAISSSFATNAISASNINLAVNNNTASYILTATGTGTVNGAVTSSTGGIVDFTYNGNVFNASVSFQQGRSATATGETSHAEGRNTQAIGAQSHAEGIGTIASGDYQHVQGQYNITSSEQSAFIIGNGIDESNKSNLVYAVGNEFQVTGSVIATQGFRTNWGVDNSKIALFGTDYPAGVNNRQILFNDISNNGFSYQSQSINILANAEEGFGVALGGDPNGTPVSSIISTNLNSSKIENIAGVNFGKIETYPSQITLATNNGDYQQVVQLKSDNIQNVITNNTTSEENMLTIYTNRTHTSKYIETDQGFVGNYLEAPSITGSLFGTASYATQALSASWAPGGTSITVKDEGTTLTSALTSLDFVGAGVTTTNTGGEVTVTIAGGGGSTFPFTGSAIITGSLTITGSLRVSGSITGSLFGTASYATQAASATSAPLYLPLAGGFLSGDLTATNRTFQINQLTVGNGSGAGNIKTDAAKPIGLWPGATVESARFLANGNTVLGTSFANTGSFRLQVSASTGGAIQAIGNSVITGSLNVTQGITGSLFGTASYALNSVSASYALTASYSNYAATASNAQNAQDILIYVKNTSGAQIDKGLVVRISGATGDNALIATASYESDGVSANTLGITTQNIPNDSFGYVMTEGTLLGINTDAFTAGQLLYLGAAGSIIGTAPQAPLHGVRLGQVLRVQQNNGSMYVRIDNGYELGELHDVRDTSTTTSYGDLLVKSGSVWVNSNQLSGSYGLTGSLTATSITGSLFGTASFAVSSSFATTSSTARTLQGLYSIKITSSSSAVTGTVAETQVLKVEIPANSLTLNEIINMPLLIMSKTGTAGTCEIRVKISTASTMPSGNTDAIARYSSGASNLFAKIQRDFIIDNGTIKVYPLSSNLIDNTTSAVAILTKAFDPTIVNYLYVSLQQSAAGDSSVLQGFYLTN